MRWLLAAAVLGLIYPYLVYPVLLAVVSNLFARPFTPSEEWPSVAILVSAFNEESRIALKIANLDSLEYPHERLEMWIGTDGSEDGTAGRIRALNNQRVHLVERGGRSGKTTVLNDLASRARADIFVFTDANALFRPDAVRRLVTPLTDPRVGLVSGRVVVRPGEGNVQVEGAYYRMDSWMKQKEGECGWLPGALGPIYALRARLYTPLPTNLINDLLHPCQVVRKGFEARFEPGAVSEEAAGDNPGREFDRQTRMAAQASYLLAQEWWPMVMSGKLGMAWVLLSHKWLRWIAGVWIPIGFVSLALLSHWLGLAALLVIALCVAGWKRDAGWASIPIFFGIVHLAYLKGLWQALTGERYVTWKPRAG